MDIIRIEKTLEPKLKENLLSQITLLDEDIFGEGAFARRYFDEITENDYDFIIACLKGEKVIGFGVIRCLDDADIFSIAVCKKERRRGIGRAILSRMTECAHSCGCKNVFLEVRSQNTPAINMYRTQGFEIIGMRRGYYDTPEDDAIIMRYIC